MGRWVYMQTAEEMQQQVADQPKINWKANLFPIITFALAVLLLLGVAVFD